MKITAATINKELKKLGIVERLRQGRGYVYFAEGDSYSWSDSSIATCYVSNLVVEGNLEKTMERVLREHTHLKSVNS